MTNKELEERIANLTNDVDDIKDKAECNIKRTAKHFCRIEDLEKRIVEIERLLKRHDDDILQLTENVDGLIEGKHRKQSHHEFKVGDRVQFKTDKMRTGIIDTIEGDFAYVQEGNSVWELKIEKLQPAPDNAGKTITEVMVGGEVVKRIIGKEDEPKCKFKVGDKVKDIKTGKICIVEKTDDAFFDCMISCNGFKIWRNSERDLKPYIEPCWTFTDDEKVILRNISAEYKWIARDECGDISIFTDKPMKKLDYGCWRDVVNKWFFEFNHLFQSIKWEDTEPCEFRKYL